ncbi:unnamed protein product, partial [Meganyctiphanes norvegica]
CNKTGYFVTEDNNEDDCINWNQYYTACRAGDKNPFQGTMSFDNIGMAWVAIFLVISLEGWTDIMYYLQDAHSFWDWIYFVLLIVIGSFFMINLCLVVIATQFSETKKREMERMKAERARFNSSSTLASGSMSEGTSCYAEIIKYIAHLWRKGKRRIRIYYKSYKRRHKHSEYPRKLSLKKQRKRRQFEAVQSSLINRDTGGIISMSQNNNTGIGGITIMNNVSTVTTVQTQLLQPLEIHSFPDDISSSSPRPISDTYDDPLLISKRPVLLKIPCDPSGNNGNSNELAPPSPCGLGGSNTPRNRRRSSVMFSDVVVMHGHSGDTAMKNVSHSEKTTQTDDDPLDPAFFTDMTPLSLSPGPQALVSNKAKPTLRKNIHSPSYSVSGSKTSLTCGELLALSGALSAALPTQLGIDSRSVHTLYSSLAKGVKHFSAPQLFFAADQFPGAFTGYDSNSDSYHSDSEWSDDDWSDEKPNRQPALIVKIVRKFRNIIKKLVDHRFFQRGILVAILINTLSMGIEYHDQPETLTSIVEMSNIVFSTIFATEMFLKVIADGPFGYISNGFNVFDGTIVIISIIELYESQSDTGTGADASQGSGLSVLRTFRLLRILKLVRFMPQLRRQLFVMLRTMDNVAIFFSLLILFIFVFSVLGMFLFGGKFCMRPDGSGDCNCSEILDPNSGCLCHRMHFNNLLWATVTVFQILTQEDWNVVLFNGMEKTSHWASLYFVALMTFGNYVLFNLLVAILVEGFSAEDEKKRAASTGSPEGSPDDDLTPPVTQLKANKERVKENQLRQKLLYGEPKCNIEKESKLLAMPGSIGRELGNDLPPAPQGFTPIPTNIPTNILPNIPSNIVINSPNNGFPIHHAYSVLMAANTNPPLITHTAATPQGSPYATMENVGGRTGDMNHLNLGKNIYNLVADQENRHKAVTRSASGSSTCGGSSHASRISLSNSSASASYRRRESLSPNDLPGRREDLAHLVKPGRARSSSGGGSPSLWQRRGSQKKTLIINNTNNFSNKRNSGDRESLVGEDSGESDTEPQITMALNNNLTINNNLNNHQAISPGGDHSQCCNGSTSSQHPGAPRRSILTQQNSIGSARTLSPQNSIRSRGSISQSRQPSYHGHVSTCGSVRELEYKPNNLELTKDDTALNLSEDGDTIEEGIELPKKILFIFEPKGCFKERNDYSLYLFDTDHPVRGFNVWLISQKWFDSTILFFIALNCITLAMERPNIPPNSAERWFLWIFNYVFTFVFAFEMLFKVIAKGLYLGKGAYFQSGWNIMDGTLVCISLVDFLMSFMENSSPRIFGILRVFRLLRALRPLRVINRAPGLKLVVMTLLSSLQPIGNIVLICCTFFIIFGILGVQLFKGTFYYCEGSDVSAVVTKADCLEAGYIWLNRKYNFDALPQALMALFVLSSKDGWVNIMYTGLDAVGVDQQPIENFSQWRLLYFISFLLLVGFFVLNMFVGVVVENFHRCREEQEKEEKARRAEKRAKKLEKKRRKMREPPYYANYSRFRLFIHNLVTSKYFDLAIAAVIGLNVITMAMEFYKMPKELEYALQIFNYFFTAVFILESCMKILALGCKRYFRDRWNQLDVSIVILSVVGIGLEEIHSDFIPINPTIIRVMRVLRIARVLKLLKMAKGIRALLDTVMQALPQVGNLGLLFFLLFFIFAALGVELFGRLECDEQYPCQGLGEHAHFKNFGMAFLTLFRVATGDNWNGIMKDTLRDQCDPEPGCVKNCCLYPFVAPIFFVIFVLMAQFVLVNVVVAVLM